MLSLASYDGWPLLTDILSPSPYAYLDGLTPLARENAIKLRQHRADQEATIALARRARDLQAELAGVMAIIEEHAQRYSRGSVTRVALDNLALEIRKRG